MKNLMIRLKRNYIIILAKGMYNFGDSLALAIYYLLHFSVSLHPLHFYYIYRKTLQAQDYGIFVTSTGIIFLYLDIKSKISARDKQIILLFAAPL
jgi:hypothetical protein